jgi:hypothetical protein
LIENDPPDSDSESANLNISDCELAELNKNELLFAERKRNPANAVDEQKK